MAEPTEQDGVRCFVDDALATVTLCRPEIRNAQSPRLWAALGEIGRTLPDEVRVVLLQAEGPSFSAGLDRRMFGADGIPGDTSLAALLTHEDDALVEQIATFQDAFTWWRRSEIVTIAAVHGHAIGAGFQLALACDLRVVADDASFVMREPALGLVPDLGGSWPLVEVVGYSRALEICLTGRPVDAAEARELGLATIVVPRDQLDATAADLAAAVLSVDHAAAAATKGLLRGAATRGYTDQLAAERRAQIPLLRRLGADQAGNIAGRSGV